ncbi:patatin-like phospholipase-like protein [Xylariales sp. PMI_506]|nr:patatin-like phospholipase-like protein [Xylariales sp. PMI_506]
MAQCNHTNWTRLIRKDQGFALEVSDRAYRILDGLPRPENQTPSIIVLVGNQSKQRLLRQLRVNPTGPRGERGHGETHLFVVPSSIHTENPILIADGDIPRRNRLGKRENHQPCHESSTRPMVHLETEKVYEIGGQIHHRLLLPFADIVCFFVTDLGGLEQLARHLASWMDRGRTSSINIRPWLVIVIDNDKEGKILDEFKDLIRSQTSIDVMDHFGGIHLVSLANKRKTTKGSHDDPWIRLNRELCRISQLVRESRQDLGFLFTARHLAGFLQHAVVHAIEASHEPFDFIHASRLKTPVDPDLDRHISCFLSHFNSLDILKNFAVPMMASSFILDHYPPGMHPFNPHKVFAILYKEKCQEACKNSSLSHGGLNAFILPLALVELLEEAFVKQFAEYQLNGVSADSHRHLMAGFQQEWLKFHSDDICFCCIRRRPQFGFPCGHSLCENCVRVFGQKSTIDPWVFHFDSCLFCSAELPDLQVRVKPDTATVRVLSIDGGGTRGRAPLEFVRVLQDRIGLPCPVQRHFDVVYGTSSGAIIAFALFVNGWSIEDCIKSFESLARIAFKPRPSFRIPIISSIYDLFISLILDSRYPATNLEAALRMVFGPTKGAMDCSKATEMGTMVGMPVTTIRDIQPCVFTNYNGVGKRDRNSDYDIVKSEGATRRIPLWELLRCATAAPYYFKPRHIDGIGTFQDGGLVYNNPSSIALEEVRVLFPATPEPSIVVSLGTGSARIADPLHTSSPRHLWKDSFPRRIIRTLWQYMNSKRAWQQLLFHQKVGKIGDFFRFDVEFDGPEPALDNVLVMDEIRDMARETILDSPSLDKLVSRIRAELFVFELDPDCPYQLVNGIYECVGRIMCRLRAGTNEFDVFMSQLDQSSAVFLVGDAVLPGRFHNHSNKHEDGNFFKKVRFRTTDRLDPLIISLRERDTACPISGSPFNLQGLIESQNLEARFGTSDHRKRKSQGEEIGDLRQKRLRRCYL